MEVLRRGRLRVAVGMKSLGICGKAWETHHLEVFAIEASEFVRLIRYIVDDCWENSWMFF